MFYIQEFMIGIASAAPIGLQNIFLFNNALSERPKKAFLITGIVWFFDAVMALLGFFGMGTLINTYQLVKLIIMFVGSLLVFYIGFSLLRQSLLERKKLQNDAGLDFQW